MTQWSANINVMMKAVRRGARGLLRDFGEAEHLQGAPKNAHNFTVKAEARARDILQEALTEARPTYGYFPVGAAELEGQDPTRRWVVSAMDGMVNFSHGLPFWSVSVALEHRGEVVSGVIYNPISDELFVAERGTGAWLNEARVRCSARRNVAEGIFVVDSGAGLHGAVSARVSAAGAGVRRLESPILSLAWLAAGRFDGVVLDVLGKSGDARARIGAALIVLKEAGGLEHWVKSVDENNPDDKGLFIAAGGDMLAPFQKTVLNDER